jgi:hypothetical protein
VSDGEHFFSRTRDARTYQFQLKHQNPSEYKSNVISNARDTKFHNIIAEHKRKLLLKMQKSISFKKIKKYHIPTIFQSWCKIHSVIFFIINRATLII